MNVLIPLLIGSVITLFLGAAVYSIALQRRGTTTQTGGMDMVRHSIELQERGLAIAERQLAALEAILDELKKRGSP